MTRNEMLVHMTKKPFEPFRVRMNNGETHDVTHPENAQLLVTDSLYIFTNVIEEPGIKELLTIAHIHNICTLEQPLENAA